ncbi:unnamed protein product [Adineta steineri]|uniref:Uncharacterized protein n=1 Tax=Adineta steineri TaxID=433720 RepID=A0A815DNT5_9BILA|nr:unnamed protein product [Adineta steineri]CAF1299407.1 unnamed protein product [Adineta steineri]
MNGIYRLVIFNIILFIQIKSACSLCNMPTAWLGSWYQRGMSSLLQITIDHVQTKGRCLDVLPIPQYYLFNDSINRCTRCLLFIERHSNLLQYRESECSDADDQLNVTSCPNMIAPDAALYTLHRNNSKPQLCPIQPPFLLTNLNKDGLICRQSTALSYIGECANDYQFRLHLLSCSSHQQTFDLQFVCVGTWIEGFHTYFVTHILSKQSNNQYACFHFLTKQKDLSSSFQLSMATDDSCRDLNSKSMSTVMTLSSINRQIGNESNISSCIFPEEFQDYEWYSLNRTIQMIIKSTDIELINLKNKGNNKRFHCLQSMNSLKYQVQSFTNCEVYEECLQINQQANNVLELVLTNCNSNNNRYKRVLTFVTKSKSLSSCPTSIGNLLLETNLNHHRQRFLRKNPFQMSVGCDNKEKLMIYQTEKDPDYRLLTQTDTCLASWRSDDLSIIYLIAQSIYSNASYCLSFQMSDSIIIRNNSHDCSFNNSEDETSISIYSAKLLNPCSQSQQLLFKYILVWITIFIMTDNI